MSPSTVPLRNTKRKKIEILESHCFNLKSIILSRLPIELISNNILCRLPIEQLLQLRCCNKAFRDLIDDTCFRKFYTDQVILASQSQNSVSNPVRFLTLIQFNEEKDCRFHFGEYDDVRNEYMVTGPITYPPLSLRGKGLYCSVIVGSCNGLVCYADHRRIRYDPTYVFNPVTRERLNLTPLVFVKNSVYASVVNGFGYHRDTKVYKVVRIYFSHQKEDAAGEVQVYTLGTGEWRNIGKVPSMFNVFHDLPGVLVNGALHWYDHEGRVASFDLATENFDFVPTPFRLMPENSSYELCAWRESLCIVAHDWIDSHLHIWVRNPNINDGSWREEFSVPFLGSTVPDLHLNDIEAGRENDDCTFITRTESGKVLQWYNDKLLSSYDLEKKERTIYGENTPTYFNDIVLHVKSFVSLKDLGEDAEIIDY